MWREIEARMEENERDQLVPLRTSFLLALRESSMRPGQAATKKMVAVEFGNDERLLWQIEGTGQYFYLDQKWQSRLNQVGWIHIRSATRFSD